MQNSKKNVVVLGAGYGGITAALRLARLLRSRPEFQVHLVDRNPFHLLKTRLHEAAVGKTGIAIPIDRLIKHRRISFHLDEVTGIDPGKKLVFFRSGAPIPFDFLITALGSETNYYGIPGLRENAFTLESLSDAQIIHDHIARLCALASSEPDQKLRRKLLRFVVGGGGLTGVEFAGEFADHALICTRNFGIDFEDVEIIVVEGGSRLVPNMGEALSSSVEKRLREKKVKILPNTRIVAQTTDAITLSSGETLETGTLIWTGGIHITDLLRESGMEAGKLGRILVDEFLRSQSFPFVYAIGDNALAIDPVLETPVPAAAQFALQQGRLVAENVYADIVGEGRKAYRPKVSGEVVSLGKHLAAGWLALPLLNKITFVGFLGRLVKSAIEGKHLLLLSKESRNWSVRHHW